MPSVQKILAEKQIGYIKENGKMRVERIGHIYAKNYFTDNRNNNNFGISRAKKYQQIIA